MCEERLDEQAYAEGLKIEELERFMWESMAPTVDGCMVECDGTCIHGYQSPLLILGMI